MTKFIIRRTHHGWERFRHFLFWWAINAATIFGVVYGEGWLFGIQHGHGIYNAMCAVAVLTWLVWGTLGAIALSK